MSNEPDPLKPSIGLLTKLGSADGHRFDAVAASALIRDPEVVTWLNGMRGMTLLPVKRK